MVVSDKNLIGIEEKPWQRGHRATYLEQEKCIFPYDADALRRLGEAGNFSLSDRRYFDEMVKALEQDGRLPFIWTPQEHHYVANHGKDKVVPYLVYRFKFRVLPERRIVSDFPVHLLIEPTSLCNLRCPMCFQTDRSFTHKGFMGTMDMNLYRNVIDQAADGGTGAISLGSRGEPYMQENMGEMLRYASDKKAFFDLKINTNATRLEEKDCHDILSSDVNLIALSIDAHYKELYEDIRVRGNFDTVLKNVRCLWDIRDRHYPSSMTEIRISGVKCRDDQDEKKFHDFWSEICDTVVYVHAQKRWNTYENPPHPDYTSPCAFLWERLYVWHDGICNPCDEDYKSHLRLGNAKDTPIRDIWHGEALTRLRENHLSGKRSEVVPCDRCGV